MAKVTLNKDQLLKLKHFISSRGFRNPGEIIEILDHFACKVEEEMEKNTSISLDEAMHRAHKSFGVMGFRRIIQAYEVIMETKYKLVYWQSFKRLFTRPFLLAAIAAFTYFFYKGYSWELHHGSRFFENYNGFGLLIYIIYFGGLILVQYSVHNLTYRNIRMYINTFEWIPWILVYTVPKHIADIHYAGIVSVYTTIVVAFIMLHLAARYHTLKKAVEDRKLLEEIELQC